MGTGDNKYCFGWDIIKKVDATAWTHFLDPKTGKWEAVVTGPDSGDEDDSEDTPIIVEDKG
jgi:hypothetical protein